MMTKDEVLAYIHAHRSEPIHIGMSGASVSCLGTDMVLKHVKRKSLCDDSLWPSYAREAECYLWFSEMNVPFVPRLYGCIQTSEEVVLLLERGEQISAAAADDRMLSRVMETLVRLHHLPIPSFLPPFCPFEAAAVMEQDRWYAGWKTVLAEHPGRFSEQALAHVAALYEKFNRRFTLTEPCLIHGDFHWDNLLLSQEDGRLLVCDWQGAGIGDPAGDISFFHSRLTADGYQISREQLLFAYCTAAQAMGYSADAEQLTCSMALGNVNLSLACWHEYLHGAEEARVKTIFDAMVQDADDLEARLAR